MWLMTQWGFYSIVQKRPGEFHIRARERQDLANLVAQVRYLDRARIIETPEADYRYRLVVEQIQLKAVLNFLGDTIDYSNFKARVSERPDQARKPYHAIWQLLADALGAYGRQPARRRGASRREF